MSNIFSKRNVQSSSYQILATQCCRQLFSGYLGFCFSIVKFPYLTDASCYKLDQSKTCCSRSKTSIAVGVTNIVARFLALSTQYISSTPTFVLIAESR